MLPNANKTILFITGAFIGHSSWNNWIAYFEEHGYTAIVPAWPGKDASPNILRKRHPDAQVAAIRLRDLIGFYENICDKQPEPPIVIGHSIGGLIAQVLAVKGKASMAVAIHSVPPRGIFTFRFSFYKAGWGPLGFFTSPKKTFLMSLKQWKYAFTNGMPEDWQEASYFSYAIPESKLVVRDTITKDASVGFSSEHAPLLFIAGENDNTIPASLNEDNYRRYTDLDSVTDFKLFPGRNHFVLGQPGWEEIASYIFDWIKEQGRLQSNHKNLKNQYS